MTGENPTPVSVTLNRRQLYMLPTRLGFYFFFALLAMLLAAVNYDNSLAYLFTFLLGAMAVVSMFYTHRNVSGLRLDPGPNHPAFAGGEAQFGVWLHNDGSRPRYGIRLVREGRPLQRINLEPGQSVQVTLSARAVNRGYLDMPKFTLASDFPLGLLFTWSRQLTLAHRCLVYPRPGPPRDRPLSPDRRRYQDQGQLPEGDDFIGLRDYRQGDSPRHVHWKAVARGRGMVTKQFGGAGQDKVWLEWDALEGLDTEARLSQLCRWVLDAEEAGQRYGLRLPRTTLAPAHGAAHRHTCLAALAVF